MLSVYFLNICDIFPLSTLSRMWEDYAESALTSARRAIRKHDLELHSALDNTQFSRTNHHSGDQKLVGAFKNISIPLN